MSNIVVKCCIVWDEEEVKVIGIHKDLASGKHSVWG